MRVELINSQKEICNYLGIIFYIKWQNYIIYLLDRFPLELHRTGTNMHLKVGK